MSYIWLEILPRRIVMRKICTHSREGIQHRSVFDYQTWYFPSTYLLLVYFLLSRSIPCTEV